MKKNEIVRSSSTLERYEKYVQNFVEKIKGIGDLGKGLYIRILLKLILNKARERGLNKLALDKFV
jgi:hypothetical protein